MSDDFTTLFKPLKKQYVCERCGKLRPTHCRVDFQIGNGFYRDIGWIAIRAGSTYERDIDLCKACMMELAEWMKPPCKRHYEFPINEDRIDPELTAKDIYTLWLADVPGGPEGNWAKTAIDRYELAPEYGLNTIKVTYRTGSSETITSNPQGTHIIRRRWLGHPEDMSPKTASNSIGPFNE